MFQQASTHPFARTLNTWFPLAYMTSTSFAAARRSDVAGSHYRAVQPDSYGSVLAVESAVINLCGDDVFSGVAGNGIRNQVAHQQPRNGCVSIRKMKTIGASIGIARRRIAHVGRGAGLQIHTPKSGQAQCPAVQRRLCVNVDSPLAVGSRLIERDYTRISFDHIEQKVAIADLRKSRLFLRGGQAGHVIDLVLLDTHDVALDIRR